MAKIDFSKLEIRVYEDFVDEDGDPRKDAAIYEGNIIVCHPAMEEKLREAQRLFFISKEDEDE